MYRHTRVRLTDKPGNNYRSLRLALGEAYDRSFAPVSVIRRSGVYTHLKLERGVEGLEIFNVSGQ